MRPDAMAQGLHWLEKARDDRRGAQILYEKANCHLACFVARQVAEGAIKAFLLAQGEELVFGHSVEALSRWAARYDGDFEELREAAALLDAYYVPTRYWDGLPDSIPAQVYRQHAAEEALRMADQVLDLVRCKLDGPGNE